VRDTHSQRSSNSPELQKTKIEPGTVTQVVVARTKPSAKTERLRISEAKQPTKKGGKDKPKG
jgi:hypothetical protein